MNKSTKLAAAVVLAVFASVSALSAKGKSKSSSITLIPHGTLGLASLGSSVVNDYEKLSPTMPIGQNLVYGAGLEANFALTKDIGIQTGVNYQVNNIGVKASRTDTVLGQKTYTSLTNGYTYSSIEVPVLITFDISDFTLEGGAYVSFPMGKLSQKGTYSIQLNDNTPAATDLSGTLNFDTKVNGGLLVGGNWTKKISGGKLVLGARYIFDLQPTKTCTVDGDGKKIDNSEAEVFTRRALLFNAGFEFAL